jgi:hypothetical protein
MSAALVFLLFLAADPGAQDAQTAPAAEPLPAYPLGPASVPDFLAPGEPFTLSDLRYSLSDSGTAQHAFAARVRYKDLGHLGAEFDGDRQAVSLLTHQLSFSAATENGTWTLGAGWRAQRLLVSADAHYDNADGHRGWQLGPTVRFRLTSDAELYGWGAGDTVRPAERWLTRYGAGALWQRGAWLEAVAEYARDYDVTGAGSENRTDSGRLSVIAQLGRAEVSGEGSLEETQGRFPRRASDAGGRLRLPLVGSRLWLEAGATGRFDGKAGELRHELRGELTWFGRRLPRPRAGQAAQRAVALARHATAGGEYELRSFDTDGLRAQRERLSLSPHAADYRGEMEALYRAQVEERAVPLLGLEVRQRDDRLTGESAIAARALVGMPWPPAWPWRPSLAGVPFLRLELEHERTTTATSFRSNSDRASLKVSLRREMDLVLGFTRAEPTALDVIRGIGVRRTFLVSWVYARGR